MNDFARAFGGAFSAFAAGMAQGGNGTAGAQQAPPVQRPDRHGRRPVAQTPEGGLIYAVPRTDYQVLTLIEDQPPQLQAILLARQRR